MGNDIIFGSCRVMSPSNKSLYITSIGWVVSVTLGAILITLSFSPPTSYASSPYGASVNASHVAEMSPFAYQVYVSYLQSPFSLCSCSKEFYPESAIP